MLIDQSLLVAKIDQNSHQAKRTEESNCCQKTMRCLQEKQVALEKMLSQLISLFSVLRENTNTVKQLSQEQATTITELTIKINELTAQQQAAEQFFNEKIALLNNIFTALQTETENNALLLTSLTDYLNSLQQVLASDTVLLEQLSQDFSCSS